MNTGNDTREQAAASPSAVGEGLTFDAFRLANVARCVKWHPAGIESWSPSDWMTAVVGEIGELASLLKMRNRERDGLPGNKFSPTDKQVADELADVLTYLDLLAAALGVNLGHAAVEKFNEVSERVGFPDRIALSSQAPKPASAGGELERKVIEAVTRGAVKGEMSETTLGAVRHEIRTLFAAECIALALAFFGAIGSARADTLRIDAVGQRIKYNGAVALIEEPTLTSPARLSFVQSGLPIGGSTQGKAPPGAVPFVLEFTDRNGVVHELACVGPPPAFDGVTFHAHFVCEVQP
jgi:NTP pyrophosphatase (non-canonical NTP hydrolase)